MLFRSAERDGAVVLLVDATGRNVGERNGAALAQASDAVAALAQASDAVEDRSERLRREETGGDSLWASP